ncbi:TetR family transcriptional regulator [Rhodococcus wratislaviensis]|uniref:TetR family transcriptional regulator n=2 Tax=Rhodococcus wratislaviensis TaxID=44752 RepID=A0AB38FHA4_RHOWR|nr:TetR/AcrR family transcriptional regulator [Rhodococcus wratislaviensis]REE73212.1 TetR family transcriptional regulator [Rhodococcus wratislaviensis]GAF46014.1 putative TetR family transcriptional regulator [Rhodococcus wratislaviensis NBRC 100605]SPZ41063.1 TetR family transcriptional regulator [Rhodococcus wratislaviensis]
MRTRPTTPTPGELRERILDAAEECLIELGYSTRLHAVIAERAGLSRPTLYKHVGDQSAILEALFQREISRFFVVLDPVLRGRQSQLQVRFVDAVVFAVQYARGHRLLQKGLRDDPEVVLPWFTVKAKPMIELGAQLLTPHFERLFSREQLSGVSSTAISEWAFRIIGSLITTEGIVDTSDERALREFVRSLLSIAFMPQPDIHIP